MQLTLILGLVLGVAAGFANGFVAEPRLIYFPLGRPGGWWGGWGNRPAPPPAPAPAPVPAPAAGGSGSTQLQTASLNMHNNFRAQHKAPPMQNTAKLNEIARKCCFHYANVVGRIDHSCPYKEGAGENLGEYSARVNHDQALRGIVQGWYNEEKCYNYANPGAPRCVDGHFSQLVWKQSTQLGTYVCDNASKTFVVSVYQQHGNVQMGSGDKYSLYRTNVSPK